LGVHNLLAVRGDAPTATSNVEQLRTEKSV